MHNAQGPYIYIDPQGVPPFHLAWLEADCNTLGLRKNRLFKVNTSCGPAGRSSFISGELKARGIAYVYDWLERSYDPPECHPGQQAWLVSYLSPQFQFSLSPAALDMYLYGIHLHVWEWHLCTVQLAAQFTGSLCWPSHILDSRADHY